MRPLFDGGRYTLDEWPHDVWHWGKPHKDGSGEWFFVVPQVLCYAVRAGLPCGIVNDDHASAVDLYLRPGARHALTLPAEMYPITTTANVLDTMAARLDAIGDLDAHTRAEAQHVMSGLWMRGPQDIAQLIAPATAEWINADTVHVGENPGLATEAR